MPELPVQERAAAWIAAFDAAVADRDPAGLSRLLVPDSHWRNLSGVSWPLHTFSGRDVIARELCHRAADFGARRFVLDPATLPPRRRTIADCEVVEAVMRFETDNGPGEGSVRLLPGPDGRTTQAWTLSTALDIDRICRRRAEPIPPDWHARSFSEPDWAERRRAEAAYADRDPTVLVVGGGHAGCTAAAELKRLGHDVLIIDREQRIGDNWRHRYHGLKLHNRTPVNHFRYMPFPETAPDYLPKDKVASLLESYVANLDLNFWTGTGFEAATFDAVTARWTATLSLANGTTRTMRPRHIILATSVSGIPNIPEVPTLENFSGTVLHSSEYEGGDAWSWASVLVLGTGTSGHDVAQELHAQGARVTMVQRSPTLVINVDPSAQIYDQIYLDDGPPLEVRDLLNSSLPYPVTKMVHQQITRRVKELDAPLLNRLRKVGFRLDFGEDDAGWPLKFRNRGGGYYFNVGCSDLIADGKIGLIQAIDIDRFTADGVRLADGTNIPADLVVLATGYKGLDHVVRLRFGDDVAERVGPIWGIDPDYHELRSMWTKTGQQGLWFTGGAFSMCRIYSRFMALQIDAIEDGRLEK